MAKTETKTKTKTKSIASKKVKKDVNKKTKAFQKKKTVTKKKIEKKEVVKTEITNKPERLDYLDGLKGLFTILVMVGHFGMMFSNDGYIGWGASNEAMIDPVSTYLSNLPMSLIINNSIPLYLFMALIAFFPAYKYFKTRDDKALVKSSVLRYFRFLPMVFVAFILSYLFRVFDLYCADDFFKFTGNAWIREGFLIKFNLFEVIRDGLLFSFISRSQEVSSLWCLYYLFLGSLLTYVFVWIIGKVKHRECIYLLVSLFLILDPTYLSFIAGVGVADIVCNSKIMENKSIMVLFLILGLIIGYFPSVFLPYWLDVTVIYAVGGFFILVGIIGLFSKSKFLNSKTLVYLGKESFSLIIVHIFVLFTITGYAYIWLIKLRVPELVALPAVFVLFATISYYASELYQKIMGPITAKVVSKAAEFFGL